MKYLFILAVLLLGCQKSPDTVEQSSDQAQIASLLEQLNTLAANIGELTAENATLTASLAQLATTEQDQTTELEGLRAIIASNDSYIDKYKDQIGKVIEALAHKK